LPLGFLGSFFFCAQAFCFRESQKVDPLFFVSCLPPFFCHVVRRPLFLPLCPAPGSPLLSASPHFAEARAFPPCFFGPLCPFCFCLSTTQRLFFSSVVCVGTGLLGVCLHNAGGGIVRFIPLFFPIAFFPILSCPLRGAASPLRFFWYSRLWFGWR